MSISTDAGSTDGPGIGALTLKADGAPTSTPEATAELACPAPCTKPTFAGKHPCPPRPYRHLPCRGTHQTLALPSASCLSMSYFSFPALFLFSVLWSFNVPFKSAVRSQRLVYWPFGVKQAFSAASTAKLSFAPNRYPPLSLLPSSLSIVSIGQCQVLWSRLNTIVMSSTEQEVQLRPWSNSIGMQVEDTRICVVTVGLPARGKSFIAQKGWLSRPLAWTGRC